MNTDNTPVIVIGIIILIIFFIMEWRRRHIEGNSPAALIQLIAKDPLDTYLSADASKYIPWWYYRGYYPISDYPWTAYPEDYYLDYPRLPRRYRF